MDTSTLSRIRSCFDYRGSNLSTAHPYNKNKVRFYAGPPWDIIWADIELIDKKYTLELGMKGHSDPHRWTDLTKTQLIKALRLYRG